MNKISSSKKLNKNLHSAKKAKNDDFYTQLSTIQDELKHYKHHFKDKVVFCNCDDPEESMFWQYFSDNFKHLGLKKLVSTHYKDGGVDFWVDVKEHPYKKEIVDGVVQPKEDLKNDGDFRSQECINILKEADIVVTNPPFSLFREYVAQLMEYNKKFLIIGNMNAVTYREIFPFIKDNKIWLGATNFNKGMYFRVPSDFVYVDTYKFERKQYGEKVNRVPGVCWFTNLDIKKRYVDLALGKTYNPDDYPKYDNYDAIEVSKVKDIPKDYDDVMGVPITFLDKYNPEQFEIVGDSRYVTGDCNDINVINGKTTYRRILIKNKKVEKSKK